MRVASTIILILLTILTVACSENAGGKIADKDTNKDESYDGVSSENLVGDDENELDEGPLMEVGQWIQEDDGTKVTLLKINSEERVLDLSPITLTIEDVKLLEFKGEDFEENIIQVSYITENSSDDKIFFNGIDVITTDAKQQIDVSMEDISGSYSSSEYHGKVKKDNYIMVPYDGEVNSIKLITNIVWDDDEMSKIHDPITEEINFD